MVMADCRLPARSAPEVPSLIGVNKLAAIHMAHLVVPPLSHLAPPPNPNPLKKCHHLVTVRENRARRSREVSR
jgi:hypothetical protein